MLLLPASQDMGVALQAAASSSAASGELRKCITTRKCEALRRLMQVITRYYTRFVKSVKRAGEVVLHISCVSLPCHTCQPLHNYRSLSSTTLTYAM